ncbi:MAG: alkaline phosphatase family protein [Candidatus Eisenbacteria bacterium]
MIGLDGATWELLQPWIDAGELPALAVIQRTWAWGELRSSIPYLSPPAWATAVTGVNPGKHAIFDFQRKIPGQSVVVNETAASRRAQPIWNMLRDAGRRSLVLNVPMTDPPDVMEGQCIAGFPHLDQTGFTYPRELEQTLPDYELDKLEIRLVPGQEDSLLASYTRARELRKRIVLDWLARERFDLLWAVFTGTDRIQHTFWMYMDAENPNYDRENAARYGREIHDYWVEQDRILGEILAKVEPDVTLLVLSDHGFGPLRYQLQLQNLLRRPDSPLTEKEANSVYCFDKSDAARLYIARRGRDDVRAWSIAEAHAVRAKLIDLLSSVTDPRTGQRICAEIYTNEQAFSGVYAEKGPDLVVVPAPGYFVVEGDRTGENPDAVLVPHASVVSGWHKMNGLFAMRGPAIRGGRRDREGDTPYSLVDVVPTLLYVLGEPIPEGLDGKIMRGLIDPAHFSTHPPATRGLLEEDFRELSPDEMENLKNLPYIGG